MSKIIKVVILVFVLILISFLFVSCTMSSEKDLDEQQEVKELNEIDKNVTLQDSSESEVEVIKSVNKTAKYKIEFIAEWSEKTHPDNYPKNAHFSPFVAYSHNGSVEAKIFSEGKLATAGVEDMAETGATGTLVKEIKSLINSKLVYQQTKGKVFDSPGGDISELSFSQEYSNFLFVSMLAPSPDWFVSGSTDLFEDGDWVERAEIDLVTFDAGTDDGVELTSRDKDSKPKQPIVVFGDELQGLGRVVLSRIDK